MSTTTTTTTTTTTNANTVATNYRHYALTQINPPERRMRCRLLRALLAFLFAVPMLSGVGLVGAG
jgi:hypothetical protein